MNEVSFEPGISVLNSEEASMVSGGVLPVLAVYAAYSFVAGLTSGLTAIGIAHTIAAK